MSAHGFGRIAIVATLLGLAGVVPPPAAVGTTRRAGTNASGTGTASPTLVSTASASVPVGGRIHDTATLFGAVAPTGSITFDLYGPSDSGCAGPPLFSYTSPVSGGGAVSPNFTPAVAGVYRWIVSYSGDANNNPAGPTLCNDPGGQVLVARVSPTLATNASPSVVVGGRIYDTASLTGGLAPTGTITFTLYGPNDNTCSGPPVFTNTVPVAGNGNYDSGTLTPTSSGFYRWIASYSGDANNNAAGPGGCNDPAEQVYVPHVDVFPFVAISSVSAGRHTHANATLSGGFLPAGAITFNLYGPDDATCARAPVFTNNVAVVGNGSYDSATFTPTAPGVYRWVAAYDGDANNPPFGPTACGDPAAAVLVRIQAPADFDGNGRTDFAVFRPSNRGWYIRGQGGAVWGASGDIAVPGDYNGDGATDIAVFRPSNGGWYIRGQAGAVWGASGDIPVPGDYNGDGTTDIAVFRPSNRGWYINGRPATVWGAPGDIPVPADYNGDGRTDIAVFRPVNGAWYIQGQTGGVWGTFGDMPVPGDYDGDGTDDLAVYRPSNSGWYVRGQAGAVWGAPGDAPVPGDYNGNGTTDIAVFRPGGGGWYVLGQPGTVWGAPGDVPLALPSAIRTFFP